MPAKINGHPATPAAILGIWGHEPKREGEYPTAYVVGAPCGTFGNEATLVSRIAYREVNYGDHALGFFDIFVEVDGKERQIVSMAARAVAEIHYEPPWLNPWRPPPLIAVRAQVDRLLKRLIPELVPGDDVHDLVAMDANDQGCDPAIRIRPGGVLRAEIGVVVVVDDASD